MYVIRFGFSDLDLINEGLLGDKPKLNKVNFRYSDSRKGYTNGETLLIYYNSRGISY